MFKYFLHMFLFLLFALLLNLSVLAHAGDDADIDAGKHLVDVKTPCSELNEEQLEQIGDYYMEQMHPGDAHVQMEEAMGGEGSEQLKQMHLQMARQMYCGENTGMMDMGGMMKGGMMNMMGTGSGYGMMGGSSWGAGFWGLLYVALVSFVFGIIFWWTYKLIVGQKKGR